MANLSLRRRNRQQWRPARAGADLRCRWRRQSSASRRGRGNIARRCATAYRRSASRNCACGPVRSDSRCASCSSRVLYSRSATVKVARSGMPSGLNEREFLLDAFDNAPEAVAPLIAARGGGDSRHGAGDRADRSAYGRSHRAGRRTQRIADRAACGAAGIAFERAAGKLVVPDKRCRSAAHDAWARS